MISPRFFAAAIVLAALLTPGYVHAQTRASFPIAYVSVQRILAEADDAKAGTQELENLRTTRAQEIAAKRQALEATRLQIANAGGYFSGSRRAQLQEVAKKQEAELQQATQQAQADFAERQREIQDRLKNDLGRILTAIASQRGLAYVLNQDASVLIGPSGADLTNEVLAKLNAAAAERSAAKPDAAK